MEQNEKVTLQKLKKEMEQMRAEYEKRLADMQPKSVDPKLAQEKQKKQKSFDEQEKWLNEYVEVKLFKDNDRYKDDVYVAINGKNCVIRRGEWTRIRRKFALLLDQSEVQDLRTAEMIAAESDKYRSACRAMGV